MNKDSPTQYCNKNTRTCIALCVSSEKKTKAALLFFSLSILGEDKINKKRGENKGFEKGYSKKKKQRRRMSTCPNIADGCEVCGDYCFGQSNTCNCRISSCAVFSSEWETAFKIRNALVAGLWILFFVYDIHILLQLWKAKSVDQVWKRRSRLNRCWSNLPLGWFVAFLFAVASLVQFIAWFLDALMYSSDMLNMNFVLLFFRVAGQFAGLSTVIAFLLMALHWGHISYKICPESFSRREKNWAKSRILRKWSSSIDNANRFVLLASLAYTILLIPVFYYSAVYPEGIADAILFFVYLVVSVVAIIIISIFGRRISVAVKKLYNIGTAESANQIQGESSTNPSKRFHIKSFKRAVHSSSTPNPSRKRIKPIGLRGSVGRSKLTFVSNPGISDTNKSSVTLNKTKSDSLVSSASGSKNMNSSGHLCTLVLDSYPIKEIDEGEVPPPCPSETRLSVDMTYTPPAPLVGNYSESIYGKSTPQVLIPELPQITQNSPNLVPTVVNGINSNLHMSLKAKAKLYPQYRRAKSTGMKKVIFKLTHPNYWFQQFKSPIHPSNANPKSSNMHTKKKNALESILKVANRIQRFKKRVLFFSALLLFSLLLINVVLSPCDLLWRAIFTPLSAASIVGLKFCTLQVFFSTGQDDKESKPNVISSHSNIDPLNH